MFPTQLSPALHVKHASLPDSINTTKPGSTDPRTPLPNAQKGVRFQPAEGGEFSTGADTGSGKTIPRRAVSLPHATEERPGLYLSTVSEPLEKLIGYGQNAVLLRT
jgi:hypothetical protein